MVTMKPTPDILPERYISVNIYWIRFFGQGFEGFSMLSIIFWLHILYRILVWWLLTFFPVGGEIIYLYYTGDDVGKVAEGLYLMLSEAYMFFKLLAFLYNKKKVLLLIDHLKSKDFYAKEPEHVIFIKKAIRRGRMVSKGYIYMCIVAIIVGCLMPIAEKFAVLPTNVKYPFFDTMESPAYQIVYLMQIYSKTSVVLLDGALDTIMPAFIAQALGQLDILAFNLENILMLSERAAARAPVLNMDSRDDRRFAFKKAPRIITTIHQGIPQDLRPVIREKLRDAIKHHISIIEYTSKIEAAFSAAAAMQFMLSGLVICLIGVQILSIDHPLSHPMQLLWMFTYFCCMMSEVFMLCWFGDDLINRSGHLQQAAFNSQWCDFPEDVKRSLGIFMERIKRPMRVTAGKIFILSLDTFTNILKWSYNAFAVMRSMKT